MDLPCRRCLERGQKLLGTLVLLRGTTFTVLAVFAIMAGSHLADPPKGKIMAPVHQLRR